jgi:hypothetical protein
MFDDGYRRCVNGYLLSLCDVSAMVGTTNLNELFTPKSHGCWITFDERDVTRLAARGCANRESSPEHIGDAVHPGSDGTQNVSRRLDGS